MKAKKKNTEEDRNDSLIENHPMFKMGIKKAGVEYNALGGISADELIRHLASSHYQSRKPRRYT